MKQLIVLIGLKGSGKTYIGSLTEKELDIPFLRVEPIFLSVKRDRNYFDKDYITEGFAAVEQQIMSLLRIHDTVLIESTGIANEFKDMVARISQTDVAVKYVKVNTRADVCLTRVKNRESKDHVNVSDEDVIKINELALQQIFDYNLIIDNTGTTNADIMTAFKSVI